MTSSGIWTIKAALDWTVGYLERKGDENPRLSAEWLLSEATGKRRIDLYVNFEEPLSLGERDVLREYVTRRGKGEPLQYITGEVAFRHINVKVRPGVLIPRPETEVLVSEALSRMPAAPRSHAPEDASAELLVADICTGSGCIACSIAYEHPLARVFATDVSDDAIALARDNAQALGLDDRVSVLKCSLGDGIDAELMGCFDAVVSNPPYVPTSVLPDIPHEVSHFEPSLALDGGADGLDLFRPLAVWAAAALKPGGILACELHEGHMDAAAAVARAAGFVQVAIVNDLAGRPRVLAAVKPELEG